MVYRSLEDCLNFLEEKGELIRVKESVDPHLELSAIHLRVHAQKGPALLFENVKGTKFRCASNIFGTLKRSKLIFGKQLSIVEELIKLKEDPLKALQAPIKNIGFGFAGLKALPLKNPSQKPVLYEEIKISDLPLIKHWPKDGGAFVTLPQVYTEDILKPGIKSSNLGMYRIQLSGNDYILNEEIGLHYQLHRGIGIHQTNANKLGKPLKVSVFVGGPPAHSVAAVMPLPEGMSEMQFAGLLAGRRFHYDYRDGYCISTDADFVITGEVMPLQNKPEGPFGDHLGYYSLQHPFPLMKVHKVYAKKNAIWPFTVVGRPPQEDTSFGELIHEITGDVLQKEIPGLIEVNAVDAAGVHPLLLAVGSERYTPYNQTQQPAELLTIANRILGTGQLSLAKFLIITASQDEQPDTKNIPAFLQFVLERINLERDVHFYTNTSIDTLDYSGTSLNLGSKIVLAAYGPIIRSLASSLPGILYNTSVIKKARLVLNGIAAITMQSFTNYEKAAEDLLELNELLKNDTESLQGIPLIILCDDADFVAASINNLLWIAFTRSNPSHDVYGINESTKFKHWGCKGPLILDARKKPHHAPELSLLPETEKNIKVLFDKGGSLFGY